MKVVIFAGGLGTRISEESYLKPKPMIEIGEKPILWHIMKIFEAQGFNEFIVCLGYKGFMIKQYFMDYYLYNSDVTFNLKTNSFEIHQNNTESFRVTLVETGLNTHTAGRLKRVQQYIGKEEFFLTYGDGVADVNLNELLAYHHNHDRIATVTAVQPAGRFGLISTRYTLKHNTTSHWDRIQSNRRHNENRIKRRRTTRKSRHQRSNNRNR